MEASAKKSFLLQSIKTGLFSLVFVCIGVLVLALLAKFFDIGDNVLPIVNQVLKGVAVILGVAMCVREDNFVLKAVVGAVIYWILSFVLFSVLGGGFHWGQIALDFAVSLVPAVIVALIKSKKA